MLSDLVDLQANLDHLPPFFSDVNNSLLLEMNLLRWKPPDLHILMISFTSCLAESTSSIDFKRSST